MPWVCDFETNLSIPTRVWAFSACEIGLENNFRYGNCIEDWINWAIDYGREKDALCYFHNAKFDCDFIINWLLKNGYEWVENTKGKKTKVFTTKINAMGQFYQMTIYFAKKSKLVIQDSLKLLPMSVSEIAKAFGTPETKLHIDYDEIREEGHILTPEELEYIHNDVTIVSKALNQYFRIIGDKMTVGSNALNNYKNGLGQDLFKYVFPNCDNYDRDIRESYKGGFCYVNPQKQDKTIHDGIVLDVNSLYPSRMMYEVLPFGNGVHFEGEYERDRNYPLYIVNCYAQLKLKPGKLPCVFDNTTNAFNRIGKTKYVTDTEGEILSLTLTSVDFELMKENYECEYLKVIDGWKFHGKRGLFDDYINHWMEVKARATVEGNKGLRTLAKLMLNSLYGKFGTNPKVQEKQPSIGSEGETDYHIFEKPDKPAVYIPMASFITAYARRYTITAAQTVIDRFCYADTDSLHLEGTELPEGLEIDKTKLGAWDHESTFKIARFVRQKTYIEIGWSKGKDGITRTDKKIACAGMPKDCHKYVTWQNFRVGARYPGKLVPIHVDGGTVLRNTYFTISK